MRILGLKPGHDGSLALLEQGKLAYSIEGEKNSFPRYYHVTPSSLLEAAQLTEELPDCVALGGWRHAGSHGKSIGTGYWGVEDHHRRVSNISLFGRRTILFETSHESSHIWAAYGMSPFADMFPCYALTWEGQIGRFYRIDEGGKITAYPQVIEQPGCKYQFLYTLAHPERVELTVNHRPPEDAGKIMALAAYGEDRRVNDDERIFIDWLLSLPNIITTLKGDLKDSPFFNIGVTSQEFMSLARFFAKALFRRYMEWAQNNLDPGLPLVIGGGCGLNCEWNTSWFRSKLFSDVFVPPCANDSGAAIGAAVQAQFAMTGSASLNWNVYCGSIERDHGAQLRFTNCNFGDVDMEELVSDLQQGHVIAVMRGRCEIGPRALGNRSLLADPRDKEMLTRLNQIKKRESYRPIAPVCTAEAARVFFDMPCEDRYMLYFSKVRDDRVPAVTHVDGTARVQVVGRRDNPFVWALLNRFGEQTGVPILCNTSLNFKGAGFLDNVSDLLRFCREAGVHRAVCDNYYVRL